MSDKWYTFEVELPADTIFEVTARDEEEAKDYALQDFLDQAHQIDITECVILTKEEYL